VKAVVIGGTGRRVHVGMYEGGFLMKVPFRTVAEALAMPRSNTFWISRDQGSVDSGNRESFYRNNRSFENLTFDISNNKVLVHMSVNGTIKALAAYRASYPVDSILPGVWWFKDVTTCGPYSFTLTIDGERQDLTASRWPFVTSFLDNIFPCTDLKAPSLEATLLVYPPMSENGEVRLRGTFYGLHLKNTGTRPLTLEAALVEKPPEGESYIPTTSFIHQPDGNGPGGCAHLELRPGEDAWLPFYIDLYPGTEELNQLRERTSLQWLAETWLCFRNLLGRLTISRDLFLHEFLDRSVLQCHGSIGMTVDGKIAGSNWGTYPATHPVWMKDMFYSYLPFYVLDTEFLKTGILWFLKRSVRPGGRYFDGRISHSVVNALTPVVLGGLYFASTGDSRFFNENPDVKPMFTDILERVLQTRRSNTGLFPSDWISDVPAIGDYHTGSNVIAWYAFSAVSALMRDVYGEKDSARRYALIAKGIRENLEARNRKGGSFGDQYVEGTDEDGEVPLAVHDGEESDVTLMPVYGYTGFDSQAYGNFARFAFSEANVYYQPELRGIRCDDFMDFIRGFNREDVQHGKFSWEEYFRSHPSIGNLSAPCLVTNIASIRNDDELFAPDGPLALIKQHTDLDGSLWWWAYPGSHENPRYEQPVRFHKAGKSAWAAGSFTVLCISEILGIHYRGIDRRLSVRPLNALGSFRWEGLRYGTARFTLSYTQTKKGVSLCVRNLNRYAVSVSCALPIGGLDKPKSVRENGTVVTEKTTVGRLFHSSTVQYECEVSEHDEKLIQVTLQPAARRSKIDESRLSKSTIKKWGRNTSSE
jgi:hypothetical protein